MNPAPCMACRSAEMKHEIGDRWQCQNCGWRQLVGDDGRARDYLPWKTAGKKKHIKRKAKSPKFKRGGCPLRW